jgi:hypothetical protein
MVRGKGAIPQLGDARVKGAVLGDVNRIEWFDFRQPGAATVADQEMAIHSLLRSGAEFLQGVTF